MVLGLTIIPGNAWILKGNYENCFCEKCEESWLGCWDCDEGKLLRKLNIIHRVSESWLISKRSELINKKSAGVMNMVKKTWLKQYFRKIILQECL